MNNSERQRTPTEWAKAYRGEFGLRASAADGWVELAVDDEHGAVHMPAAVGERVLPVLIRRGFAGPVMARNHHTYRWTFLVDYDRAPGRRHELDLDLIGVCVQPPGSALVLPAGYGSSPVVSPGAWWIREPEPHRRLPWLSAVISTTLAVSAPATTPIPRMPAGDCDVEPVDLTPGAARRIRAQHASHTPDCKQALTARAYLSHTGEFYV